MARVEPIRDLGKVSAIKKILREQENPRDYLLFVFGINTTLRIGDLLRLTIGDVLNEKGEIRALTEVPQNRPKRATRIPLNENVCDALAKYFAKVPPKEPGTPLFRSMRSSRPIDRTRAWRLVNDWCTAVSLTKAHYGAQTLRKTWGYMARKVYGIPIDLIQARLGHASPAVTKRYLGITDEKINDVERRVLL